MVMIRVRLLWYGRVGRVMSVHWKDKYHSEEGFSDY